MNKKCVYQLIPTHAPDQMTRGMAPPECWISWHKATRFIYELMSTEHYKKDNRLKNIHMMTDTSSSQVLLCDCDGEFYIIPR